MPTPHPSLRLHPATKVVWIGYRINGPELLRLFQLTPNILSITSKSNIKVKAKKLLGLDAWHNWELLLYEIT